MPRVTEEWGLFDQGGGRLFALGWQGDGKRASGGFPNALCLSVSDGWLCRYGSVFPVAGESATAADDVAEGWVKLAPYGAAPCCLGCRKGRPRACKGIQDDFPRLCVLHEGFRFLGGVSPMFFVPAEFDDVPGAAGAISRSAAVHVCCMIDGGCPCFGASFLIGFAFLVFQRYFVVGGQAPIENKDEFMGAQGSV